MATTNLRPLYDRVLIKRVEVATLRHTPLISHNVRERCHLVSPV